MAKNKTQKLENKWRKGIDIPAELFIKSTTWHLRHSEIIIYLELFRHRDYDEDTLEDYNTVELSFTDLTNAIGIYDRSTIVENIKRLEDKKLIKVDRRNLTNIYTLVGVPNKRRIATGEV